MFVCKGLEFMLVGSERERERERERESTFSSEDRHASHVRRTDLLADCWQREVQLTRSLLQTFHSQPSSFGSVRLILEMQSGISVDLYVSPPPSTASRSINIIICDCLCLGAVHMSFDSGTIMRQACLNCPSINMICLSCFVAAKECGSQASDRPLILCRTILHRLDYTLPPPSTT